MTTSEAETFVAAVLDAAGRGVHPNVAVHRGITAGLAVRKAQQDAQDAAQQAQADADYRAQRTPWKRFQRGCGNVFRRLGGAPLDHAPVTPSPAVIPAPTAPIPPISSIQPPISDAERARRDDLRRKRAGLPPLAEQIAAEVATAAAAEAERTEAIRFGAIVAASIRQRARDQLPTWGQK